MSAGEAYARSVGMLRPEQRARLFTPTFQRALNGHRAEDRYVAAMAAAPARTALDQAQYADLKIWLPGDILTKVDRTSMGVGLEVREPMLDHKLVEFAARLPTQFRIGRGQGKALLKRSMAGHLPSEILYRPKMGFVAPLSDWFRGPMAEDVQRLSQRSHLLETGWFQADYISECLREHQSGRRDHGRFFWQLLLFEASWAQLFSPGSVRR